MVTVKIIGVSISNKDFVSYHYAKPFPEQSNYFKSCQGFQACSGSSPQGVIDGWDVGQVVQINEYRKRREDGTFMLMVFPPDVESSNVDFNSI